MKKSIFINDNLKIIVQGDKLDNWHSSHHHLLNGVLKMTSSEAVETSRSRNDSISRHKRLLNVHYSIEESHRFKK